MDSEEIVSAYKAGESASSLARKTRNSPWKILDLLRKAGVPVRANQNERRLNLEDPSWTAFLSVQDGLLLGDGSIDRKGSLRIEQCPARTEWLSDLQQQLQTIGCASRIIPLNPRDRSLEGRVVKSNGGSLLYTPCYAELQAQRKRWYPDGVKVVPRDLSLNPVVLAQWFAGDGTYDEQGALFFCTNGFLKEDTEFLVKSLTVLGIKARCTPVPSRPEFRISITCRNDAVLLRDLMLPHLPQCVLYKVRFVRSATPRGSHARKLSDGQVLEIRAMAASGQSQNFIAGKFGISQASVSSIVLRRVYQYL